MKKAELKQKYDEWNRNNWNTRRIENNSIFKELQELNFTHGSGNRWCSINLNLIEIISKSGQQESIINKALDLFEKYNKNIGASEAVEKLALATKNFEI